MSDISTDSSENRNNLTNEDKGCDYCDVFKSLLSDMPFSITIVLIASFFIAFIIVMIVNPDLFRDISAIWGAWIGTAIGYFFGSRPVEALSRKIDRLLDDLDDSTERDESLIDDYEMELENCKTVAQDYKDKYDSIKNMLQHITDKHGQSFDADLLSRLKNNYNIIP